MPSFDLPLDDLRDFQAPLDRPSDFDTFWASTLDDTTTFPAVTLTRADEFFGSITVYSITFAGYQGQRIRGWILDPGEGRRRTTGVLHIPGYNNGRGFAHQWLPFAVAGFTVMVMDVRGQGATSEFPGATPDIGEPTGAEVPGFLTRGISSPQTAYLRRLYVDGFSAIDAFREACQHLSRVTIVAGSQGGGVGLAISGLRSDIDAAIFNVPSFALWRRAYELGAEGSRAELGRMLAGRTTDADDLFGVLSYFDTANFTESATAPAWFSAALFDHVCPPSTVFGAYNRYVGPKHMTVWSHNGHESGGAAELQQNLATLADWHDQQSHFG